MKINKIVVKVNKRKKQTVPSHASRRSPDVNQINSNPHGCFLQTGAQYYEGKERNVAQRDYRKNKNS